MYKELGVVFVIVLLALRYRSGDPNASCPAIRFAYIIRLYRAATSYVLFTLVSNGRQIVMVHIIKDKKLVRLVIVPWPSTKAWRPIHCTI